MTKKLTVVKVRYDREVYAHHIDAGRVFIATIEKNDSYRNFPYGVYKLSGTRFVTKNGYDCFRTISDAKSAIAEEITDFYKYPEYLLNK